MMFNTNRRFRGRSFMSPYSARCFWGLKPSSADRSTSRANSAAEAWWGQ
jgi:hypothetical protein